MPVRVDIVIVNWNSGGLLRRCLEALAASVREESCVGRVIVVDNASRDGSAEVADLDAALPLLILRNEVNRGFAAACNKGAAQGCSGQILFLNPDVVVRPGALLAASRALAEGEAQRIGILGILLVDEHGATQRCTARFPTPWALLGRSAGLDRWLPSLVPPAFVTDWDHETTRDVDQVMGAFLLIRRDLFESLGGFDERFFVYYDDVDLCLRARDAGWRRVHFAGASAMHEGQGTTRAVKDIRLFYLLRSRLLYARKHFGPVRQGHG